MSVGAPARGEEAPSLGDAKCAPLHHAKTCALVLHRGCASCMHVRVRTDTFRFGLVGQKRARGLVSPKRDATHSGRTAPHLNGVRARGTTRPFHPRPPLVGCSGARQGGRRVSLFLTPPRFRCGGAARKTFTGLDRLSPGQSGRRFGHGIWRPCRSQRTSALSDAALVVTLAPRSLPGTAVLDCGRRIAAAAAASGSASAALSASVFGRQPISAPACVSPRSGCGPQQPWSARADSERR
eukprot:365372-Chlamydomonas_euryale.AAC.12